MPQYPIIAIVGRPNVGKSSLLNALVNKRVSIVQDMPGVTRDRVSMPLRIGERYVELMDTGGYGFVDPDQLTEHIKRQIELAMAQSQLVLFVVDTQDGLTSADQNIASLLRRRNIKTVLIANKADGPKADAMLGDFARLGFGTPVGVSAINDRNLSQILDAIRKNVDLSLAPTEPPQPQMMVAIVGKRNAGKSTLVNAIAEVYEGQGDRVIVSEIPGTTRDSVDVRFEKEGKTLVVIDTAGVRKKRHMVTDDVEFYSFHRAERSIRRADVVFMLLDGMEPLSEPDKKLAAYIAAQHKPVVLVVNKWDLVLESAKQQAQEKKTSVSADLLMEEFREYVDQDLRHLDYAPIAFITAKDGKKVEALLDLAQRLFKQTNERLTTHKLNDVVKQILTERRPSTSSGRKARIYYVTQTDVAPPTIVLFVNNEHYIDETYQRFMINRMRELLPYGEVPIKLVVREKQRQKGPTPKGQGPVASLDEAADQRPSGRATRVSTKPRVPSTAKARTRGGTASKPSRATGRGKGPRGPVRR